MPPQPELRPTNTSVHAWVGSDRRLTLDVFALPRRIQHLVLDAPASGESDTRVHIVVQRSDEPPLEDGPWEVLAIRPQEDGLSSEEYDVYTDVSRRRHFVLEPAAAGWDLVHIGGESGQSRLLLSSGGASEDRFVKPGERLTLHPGDILRPNGSKTLRIVIGRVPAIRAQIDTADPTGPTFIVDGHPLTWGSSEQKSQLLAAMLRNVSLGYRAWPDLYGAYMGDTAEAERVWSLLALKTHLEGERDSDQSQTVPRAVLEAARAMLEQLDPGRVARIETEYGSLAEADSEYALELLIQATEDAIGIAFGRIRQGIRYIRGAFGQQVHGREESDDAAQGRGPLFTQPNEIVAIPEEISRRIASGKALRARVTRYWLDPL